MDKILLPCPYTGGDRWIGVRRKSPYRVTAEPKSSYGPAEGGPKKIDLGSTRVRVRRCADGFWSTRDAIFFGRLRRASARQVTQRCRSSTSDLALFPKNVLRCVGASGWRLFIVSLAHRPFPERESEPLSDFCSHNQSL